MKDWRGTDIEVGSTIVYPSRTGSAMWMVEAVVDDVYMVERYGRKEPRLRVKRKKETSPYLGNDYRLVQGRPTVLHAVDRVTVVG